MNFIYLALVLGMSSSHAQRIPDFIPYGEADRYIDFYDEYHKKKVPKSLSDLSLEIVTPGKKRVQGYRLELHHFAITDKNYKKSNLYLQNGEYERTVFKGFEAHLKSSGLFGQEGYRLSDHRIEAGVYKKTAFLRAKEYNFKTRDFENPVVSLLPAASIRYGIGVGVDYIDSNVPGGALFVKPDDLNNMSALDVENNLLFIGPYAKWQIDAILLQFREEGVIRGKAGLGMKVGRPLGDRAFKDQSSKSVMFDAPHYNKGIHFTSSLHASFNFLRSLKGNVGAVVSDLEYSRDSTGDYIRDRASWFIGVRITPLSYRETKIGKFELEAGWQFARDGATTNIPSRFKETHQDQQGVRVTNGPKIGIRYTPRSAGKHY